MYPISPDRKLLLGRRLSPRCIPSPPALSFQLAPLLHQYHVSLNISLASFRRATADWRERARRRPNHIRPPAPARPARPPFGPTLERRVRRNPISRVPPKGKLYLDAHRRVRSRHSNSSAVVPRAPIAKAPVREASAPPQDPVHGYDSVYPRSRPRRWP